MELTALATVVVAILGLISAQLRMLTRSIDRFGERVGKLDTAIAVADVKIEGHEHRIVTLETKGHAHHA